MILRWYGHSCFLFYSKKGTRVLTDPYGEGIGYPFPPTSCEAVTISHEHQDHNAVWRVSGAPLIANRTNPGICEHEFTFSASGETLIVKGIPTYHDEAFGTRRGPNTVFVWKMDGYRICHLGDLGHNLTNEQILEIGPVDILLLPVGGAKQVLNPREATLTVDALQPSLVFPMHYKTDRVDMGLEPVENFVKLMTQVEQVAGSQMEIVALPKQPTVVILKYG